MLGSDVVNQLHHVHGLAYTGTAKQSYLTAFCEWANQVDYLDSRLQQLVGAGELLIGWCLAMNGHAFLFTYIATLVDGSTQHVHDTAQSFSTNWDRYRCASVLNAQPAAEPFGTT